VRALSVSEYIACSGWPKWAAERNADWHEGSGLKLKLASKGNQGWVTLAAG
jgi:hypothetical protein